MSFSAAALRRILDGRRTRGASLPWHELEAEAARQGCSPADIFFDRAGRAEPNDAGLGCGRAARGPDVSDTDTDERGWERRAWRGHDPLPAPRQG